MNPLQQRVFEMFVAMGDERSLPKLLSLCKAQEIETSEPTLKRWSSKFKWQELAQHTGEEVARQIAKTMLPDHVARTKKDLETIGKLKAQFEKDVEDGNIQVTLTEYISLIKTEQLLTGNPTDRSENSTVQTLKIELKDSDLAALLRKSEQNKRGLPSVDIIDVTPGSGRDDL